MPHLDLGINPKNFLKVYHPLLESDNDIEFLWGSRDSGKSRFIAQQLILECMRSEYFLCPLFRKVQNTIKDSQWQMLKLVVEYWELDQYFDFNSSPLEIRCVNGNKFLARGLDDPLKIKSLTNPSHAWIEEASDLEQEDWILIFTSLRSDYGKTKIWCSFNPDVEGDYMENFIYKTFFVDNAELNFNNTLAIETESSGRKEISQIKYRVTHSTYHDNPYCDAQRKYFYESLKKSNPYEYQVYALGIWGRKITGGEFLKEFKLSEHTGQTEADADKIIHLSIDSNVYPYITSTFWQLSTGESTSWDLDQIHEILAVDPNNTARRAGEMTGKWLRDIGYNQEVWMYGDRSVKNANNIDDEKRSFFEIYCDSLRKYGYKIVDKFLRYAPPVSAIGDFLNAILSGSLPIAKITIGTHCQKSITDYLESKQDKDGSILKVKIKDKRLGVSYEKNGHICDSFKDLVVQMFYDDFTRHQNRFNKVMPGGISSISRVPRITF